VFRADSDNIEQVDRLQRRVRAGVSRLRGIEIGDELSIEVLAQLIDNRKSQTEIVEGIYGLSRPDEGFKSCYTRIGRELRRLESKGLVSRQLFGRDKPYRLTQHAVINLAKIGGREQQVPILPAIDIPFYLAMIVSGVLVGLSVAGLMEIPELSSIGLFGIFCVLFGISITRFAQTVRRVL
jgi:hypothetical protein